MARDDFVTVKYHVLIGRNNYMHLTRGGVKHTPFHVTSYHVHISRNISRMEIFLDLEKYKKILENHYALSVAKDSDHKH